MFNHFLITRFNLKRSDWKTNKNNEVVLTDEWHKNRFSLFTNFCFPSVASQSNKNFEWLVFFDSSTTKEYRDLIKTLAVEMPNFKPFFIDGMDQFLPSLKSYISKFNEDFIITSGLDNDDCISKNYIKEVQTNFNKQDFLALDFVDGFTLQISPDIKLGKKLHQYNPFISLIEKNINFQTVCSVSHRLWKKEKRILQIKNKRIWSSVIHQENKVNEFTGFGNVNGAEFFENFIISDEKRSFLQKNIIPQNKWIISSTINNCSSHWNIIFKNFKKRLGLYN